MSTPTLDPESQTVAARKRGRPTEDERVERRSQILDASLAVFLEHGFGHATIGQLAAASQVTKRTIYTYFGGKSDVFAAMVQELAETVSSDGSGAPDVDTLETLATRIVYRVHSDELVGLHRLVIAESSRFPELAQTLFEKGDVRHMARLAEHIRRESGEPVTDRAELLFSLLLGEAHRNRLLGLEPAPSLKTARSHARRALAALGLG
jgi:TetR/AcrR family transcriptional regulator, mexJK operon transcriptional repressor